MPIYGRQLKGAKVYRVRVKYRGHEVNRVCPTREAAQAVEAEIRIALRKQAADTEREGLRPATLRLLFESYVADLEARGKPADTVGRAVTTAKAVETCTPELLDRPVSRLRNADLFTFREARSRDGAKPATVNRDLRTLRAMLKRADVAFPGGLFFPEDETRVRWLRPEEEILVLEVMPSPFREIAKLAALTLMRQGELLTLRRDTVHLEQGVVLLPKAKAGARPVILSAAAQEILAAALGRNPESEWVFPGPDGRPWSRVHVSRVFRQAALGAGLVDFHFHDLRHHGATMALNAGFSTPILMQLGGWRTEKMVRRYAAVTDPTLRAAAEAVSGRKTWAPATAPVPVR